MRISDWSSDVCSSDLLGPEAGRLFVQIGREVDRRGARHDAVVAGRQDGVPQCRQAPEPCRAEVVALHVPASQSSSNRLARFRSEERRVGKDFVSTFRLCWSLYHLTKKYT